MDEIFNKRWETTTNYYLFSADHICEYITTNIPIHIGCDQCIYQNMKDCCCHPVMLETTACKICTQAEERITELKDELDEVTYFLVNNVKKTYLVDNNNINRIYEIAEDLNRLNRLKLLWKSKPITHTKVEMVDK